MKGGEFMIKIRTYIRWGFVIIGIIIVVVGFLRFKDYFLPVLAVIGGAINYIFSKQSPKDPVSRADRQQEQEAIRKIDTVKQHAATTDQQQESLDQRIDDLEERVSKRRSGHSTAAMTLLIGLFLVAGTAWAANGELYIPPGYNELKQLYIEADNQVLEALDIINKQRQQIADLQKQRDEALQAAETFKEVNRDKDKIIAGQAAKLERLNHSWGVSAGGQAQQGFILGLSRRIDCFSVGVGLSSQGNVFGNCTFWF
jgi:hypothetical protein